MEVQNQSNIQRFSEWLKGSLGIKLFSIGLLVLILLIPNALIRELIQERQGRQETVRQEVSQSWGGSQGIQGPVLAVPYLQWKNLEDGKRIEERHMAYFLPLRLHVEGDLKHQVRKRSIFDVILYQAQITLTGEFQQPDFQLLNINTSDVLWNEARLLVGIQGMTGVKEVISVDWNGKSSRLEPGAGIAELLPSAVSCPIALPPDGTGYKFSIPVKLNGTEEIRFEPVGKSTTVSIASDWHSPSFEGAFLPDQRNITDAGFTAQWQVLDLNRAYPQQWKDAEVTGFGQSQMVVRLLKPVDEYMKNTRSAKYAILVIGLTFLLYFFFEVLRRLFIHPFQYLLVGLALTVFYLLLLSLSEHIGFDLAYACSTLATVGLIAGYSFAILGDRRMALQLFGLLTGIYGFIYILLQLEDFALLAGSVGVFVVLATLMYSSRKIDWYNLGNRNPTSHPQNS